jgi:hypothetical protein
LPSEYLALPILDKAFVTASILVKIDNEKKAQKEAERKGKSPKGKRGKRR